MPKVQEQVNLAKYTTLGVGGNAEYFARASDRADLLDLLVWAHEKKVPVTVLGGGSNVLISESGIKGLFIVNRARKISLLHDKLSVESGAILGAVARETIEAGLLGLEWASGIPGTVGGAIVGNAGALEGHIADVLVTAEVWHDGELVVWHNADFEFEYRSSKLKGTSSYHIVSAEFHLLQKQKKGLKSERGFRANENVAQVVEEDKSRRSKNYRGKTAGSYFKNPAGFTAGDLIERAGLKGYRIGGAEVATEHANVIRNYDSATATDIYTLEKHIIKTVRDKFGITLVPEVLKIGKF